VRPGTGCSGNAVAASGWHLSAVTGCCVVSSGSGQSSSGLEELVVRADNESV
jgi:hypothetical protein